MNLTIGPVVPLATFLIESILIAFTNVSYFSEAPVHKENTIMTKSIPTQYFDVSEPISSFTFMWKDKRGHQMLIIADQWSNSLFQIMQRQTFKFYTIQINSACLFGNISLFNCTSSQNSIQCCKRKTLSLDPKDCLYCKQIWIQLFLLAEEVLLGNGEGSRGHRRRFITGGKKRYYGQKVTLWLKIISCLLNIT